MNNSSSVKKIALIGPYGFGNLGDAAIQDSMIQNIRKRCPNVEIYGISQNPEDTFRRHGIPAFPISRMPRKADRNNRESRKELQPSKAFLQKVWNSVLFRKIEKVSVRFPIEIFLIFRSYKKMKGFNLLVVSGGGQLDDYWGGAWSHPYALLKWSIISKLRKAKVVFVSVGAGPLDYALSRRFIKYALSMAIYKSYRDEESKRLVESIGVIHNNHVCPDLAYGIHFLDKKRPASPGNYNLVVGIGPMTYFHPRYWPEQDYAVYMKYLKKLALFTAWLIQNGSKIVLFPGEAGADQIAMKDLKDILNATNTIIKHGQIIQETITTVNELITSLSSVDLIVASRFHGVLLAHVVCRPVLAISYHQKIDSLMREVGHSDFCVDINQFDVEDLKHRFQRLHSNADLLRSQIEKKTNEYRKSLDIQFDDIIKNSGILD